ncbi:MAG TPA: hypothetical protein VFJ65_01235 [Solirubrobacterales bacterium]|nr:hypothetical protein [Solirubrobacterales bacterium]
MTQRQALIAFITGVLLVELIGMALLGAAGADSETKVTAYALLVSVTGLGGGFVFLHYH